LEEIEIMDAREEESLDIEDARAARAEAQEKGTIPLAVLKEELGLEELSKDPPTSAALPS
jgi:hypothetical protein